MSKLRWLALVPAAFLLGLAVWAVVDERWWSVAKHLVFGLFFVSIPWWGSDRRAPEQG